MRRLFIAAVAVLLSCETGFAQTTTIPGIGMTSPLGIPGSTSSGLPTGIPLGATEVNPGGLGLAPIGPTMPTASCLGTGSSSSGMIGSAMSGTLAGGAVSGAMTGGALSGTTTNGVSGTAGMTSSFDGGGVASAGCPLPSSGVVSSAGTASPMPGTIGTTRLNGGVIPLGATETNGAGLSPLIGVPTPGATITPCIGSTTTGGLLGSSSSSGLTTGSIGTSGMTSTSGC